MKKVFIIVLMVLLSVVAASGDSVTNMNGYDWTSWTSMEKVKYVQGYFTGLEAYRQLFGAISKSLDLDNPAEKTMDEMLYMFSGWGYYGAIVNDMIILIDRYYSAGGEYIQYPIHEVIMVQFDKDWWND